MIELPDDRYTRLEARLSRLEAALGLPSEPGAATKDTPASPVPEAPVTATPQVSSAVSPAVRRRPNPPQDSASSVMAWGAALSFVLAAVYFIKLVLAAGWLTPARQIGIAAVAGASLIATGLKLARYDRAYAAYLPAAGIVILYLAIYGAHLYYGLVGMHAALGVVAAISITAIALGAHFRRSAYAVLAGICVYTAPLLLETVRSTLLELILYFTAWSLVFSYCALHERRRLTYLVPLYLAFLCFDAAWRLSADRDWPLAATYQFVQFVIFAGTAAWFSIKYSRALDSSEAVAHALPLLYFYASEYLLISEHAPVLARLLALGSAALLLALWGAAQRRLAPGESDTPAAVLVSAYCCLVTTHIVFFEYLPTRFLPWAALALPPVLMLLARQGRPLRAFLLPIWLTTGGLMLLGLAMVLLPGFAGEAPSAPLGALAAYAVLMYGCCFSSAGRALGDLKAGVLYAAHGATMVLALRVFDSALTVSVVWAGLAVAMLLIALRTEDRLLGQSSLVIFAASALKVLLFDLSGSAPVIRIGVLVVLGSSLYAGGWLYQGLARRTVVLHPDRRINAQIARIAALVEEGLDDVAIGERLTREGVECLAKDGWSSALVAQIRRDYALGE